MIHYTFARPHWRAIFVGTFSRATHAKPNIAMFAVLLFAMIFWTLFASPVEAQFRAAWDANAAITQFEHEKPANASAMAPVYGAPAATADSRWLAQRAMGGALRYNHPFAQFNADALVRDGDVASRLTGGMSALFASPAWNGFRVSASYDGRHIPNDGEKFDSTALISRASRSGISRWQSVASANISYARNATGLWLRATNQQGALASDSVSRWAVMSGLTHQFGNMSVGISFGGRNTRTFRHWSNPTIRHDSIPVTEPGNAFPGKLDTTHYRDTTIVGVDTGTANDWRRWSETAAAIGWSHGRFAFDATLSARPKLGNYESAVWGGLSAVAAITSRVALVASTHSTPNLPGIAFSAQKSASIALRVAPPALFRPPPPTPIRSTSTGFRVQSNGSGNYTITVNVPSARSVELAGDFTAWEAIKMRQITNTRWEISIPVAPGSHRCNLRIDGADWVPPPGIPSITDEFNGRVGLFVAE